jgi:hypothetical protein
MIALIARMNQIPNALRYKVNFLSIKVSVYQMIEYYYQSLPQK